MNSKPMNRIALAASSLLLAATLFGCQRAPAAEQAAALPAPALDNPQAAGAAQTAVLSGGCFWGVQGVFEHVRGVRRVVAGYAGGDKSTAQYETVSAGGTGHDESVEVTFDPAQVSYGELLRVFFSVVH